MKARKRERVRCSSLFGWPVYPCLAHTMRPSNDAQCGAGACVRSPRSVARRAEIARAVEKVIEVTPQGWADRGAGCAARSFHLSGAHRRERAAKARRNGGVKTSHGLSLGWETFANAHLAACGRRCYRRSALRQRDRGGLRGLRSGLRPERLRGGRSAMSVSC